MFYVTEMERHNLPVLMAVVLGVILWIRGDRWVFVLLLIVLAFSDFTTLILKKTFVRPRPCHALEGIRLLVGCGSSYSFPSAHAANIFSTMGLLSLNYHRCAPFLITIAFLVAYSRIYMGVHYPFDVVSGMVLGSAYALVFFKLQKRFIPRVDKYLCRKFKGSLGEK